MGEPTPTRERPPVPGGHPRRAPRSFLAALKAALPRIKVHDIPSLAAGVAFKIFLSLFPAAVAATAVFSLVGDPAALLERVEPVVPDEVATLLEDRVLAVADTGGAGLLALAGVLGGLWAASSAAGTLMKALSRINGTVEERGFVQQRLIALAIILALLAAIAGLVALIVLGPQLQALLLPEDVVGGAAGPLLAVGQLVGAVAILIVLFAFVYWIGPDLEDRPPWEWWSPGAVVAVVGWLVASGGFSLYTQTAGNYEATYAGLAGVIVTLVWLQLSMAVLLFGAEVNVARRRLEERAVVLEDAAGAGLAEPTSEPLEPAPPRPELPAPVSVADGTGPARAALAATAGVAAAVAAVAAARFRGRG